MPERRDPSTQGTSPAMAAFVVGALIASALFAASTSMARADEAELPLGDLPAGELRCTVQGDFEAVVSANRVLNCRYDRPAARSELYTGYTGITGTGFGQAPNEALIYQVYSATPNELAALNGNFKGSASTLNKATSGDLLGGQSSNILLRPEVPPNSEFGAASNYALINAIAGFGYLHLIYNGVVPANHRRHH